MTVERAQETPPWEKVLADIPQNRRIELLEEHMDMEYVRTEFASNYDKADGKLKKEGIPAWALVGYLMATNWDMEQTRADYDIEMEKLEAAVVYYIQYKDVIDAKLLLGQ